MLSRASTSHHNRIPHASTISRTGYYQSGSFMTTTEECDCSYSHGDGDVLTASLTKMADAQAALSAKMDLLQQQLQILKANFDKNGKLELGFAMAGP